MRCTGVVPPIKFIPQLEAENTIRFIDFFVLEEVCVMLKGWQEQGISLFPISMNFSRSTVMEDGVVEKNKSGFRPIRRRKIPFGN